MYKKHLVSLATLIFLAAFASAVVFDVNIIGDTDPLPSFSYARDGSIGIPFNVISDNNSIIVDMNYSSSKVEGTGTPFVEDFNLSSSTICEDTDFTNITMCAYYLDLSAIPDGNYFILIRATDGFSVDFDASDGNLLVDNTAPSSWASGGDINADVNMTGVINGIISTDNFIGKDQNLTIVVRNTSTSPSASSWGEVKINFNDLNVADVNANTGWRYFTKCNDNNSVCTYDVNIGTFDINFAEYYITVRVTDSAGNTGDANLIRPLILYSLETPADMNGADGNTTNFQSITNFAAISNLMFTPNNGYGKIRFLSDVNLSSAASAQKLLGETFLSALNISMYTGVTGSLDKNITVNRNIFAELGDVNAEITVYGLPTGLSKVGIRRNDQNCGSYCSAWSYNINTGQLDFNVTGWSSYITDTNRPVFTSATPSGTINSTIATIRVITNEPSTCRFSENNVAYDSMTSSLVATSDGLTHEYTYTNLTNGTKTYYIQCLDLVGWDNNTVVSFTINASTGGEATIYCGDGTCNGSETCGNCSTDCGSCSTGSTGGGGGDSGEGTPAAKVIILHKQSAGKPTADYITNLLTSAGASQNAIEKASAAVGKVNVNKDISVEKTGTGTSAKYTTTVSFTVNNPSNKKMKNVKVIIEVPKIVAERASHLKIPAGLKYTIIKDDPILEFTIDEVDAGSSKTISYSVSRNIDEATADLIPQAVVAELTEETVDPCLTKSCDDSNPCTIDTCTAGTCRNTALVCGVGKECKKGSCVAKEVAPATQPEQPTTSTAATTPKADYTLLIGAIVLVVIIGAAVLLFVGKKGKNKLGL